VTGGGVPYETGWTEGDPSPAGYTAWPGGEPRPLNADEQARWQAARHPEPPATPGPEGPGTAQGGLYGGHDS
jgi:hypothetical protein